jgi:hypothetical protein
MNNDMKTNITGVISGIAGLLAMFHIVIPQTVTAEITFIAIGIGSIAIIAQGYFTNKSDVSKPPPSK